MFQRGFVFGENSSNHKAIKVSKDTLYSKENQYGFVIEKNRNEDEALQITELNSAFEPHYWYSGVQITSISQNENGCYINSEDKLPLTFKLDVPEQGNYNVKISIESSLDIEDLMIFSQRRRCMLRGKSIKAGESFVFLFTANVCDIIPRGKLESYTDKTLDITVIANRPTITSIEIEQVDVPTLYIAGDSTLTDQSAAYPYDPATSYCGWAQMLPLYLKPGIAVSNHSHSGLTTESFRKEGHYAIVEKYIKPGDILFMQFAHNDQKLLHLGANTGYADNLRQYVDETISKGAFPVIVTPLSRTTWRGNDGGFNDLLIDYANACKQVAKEKNIPLLDLHSKSVKFITTVGLTDSERYFFPKDRTHSNDYGAYLMADFVVEEIKAVNLGIVNDFVRSFKEGWAPPVDIELPQPPAGFETKINVAPAAFKVGFTDIEDCSQKDTIVELTAQGIIPNDDTLFRPNDMITRVEILSMIIKVVKFIPTNVYNDMYGDVVGHEWYAGIVECASTYGMVDPALLKDKNFKPNNEVTYEELVSFCVNAYKSRMKLKKTSENSETKNVSQWAKEYINIGESLDLLHEGFVPNKGVLRKEAVEIVEKLVKLI